MSADYIPTRQVSFKKYLKIPGLQEDLNEGTTEYKHCIKHAASENFVWVYLNTRGQVISMTRFGGNNEDGFMDATEEVFAMKWCYVG